MDNTGNYSRIKLANGWLELELSLPSVLTSGDIKKIQLLMRVVEDIEDDDPEQSGRCESDGK